MLMAGVDPSTGFLKFWVREAAIDAVNGAYQLLDLVPKAWARHHDEYSI
jgi:hypothetical protein